MFVKQILLRRVTTGWSDHIGIRGTLYQSGRAVATLSEKWMLLSSEPHDEIIFEPNEGFDFSGSAFEIGEYGYQPDLVLI